MLRKDFIDEEVRTIVTSGYRVSENFALLLERSFGEVSDQPTAMSTWTMAARVTRSDIACVVRRHARSLTNGRRLVLLLPLPMQAR